MLEQFTPEGTVAVGKAMLEQVYLRELHWLGSDTTVTHLHGEPQTPHNVHFTKANI